ncbi:MAG TPA: GWxTD domain-containing protein [Longimicrobiales bacterium]
MPRRILLAAVLPVLIVIVVARRASAQDSPFDARAMKDSLARVTDRRAIRLIEARHADRRSAGDALTAGFAALRLYELSHIRDDARNARRHFSEARSRDARSPWPLYGWALAMLPEVKEDGDLGRFGFAGDDELMNDLGLDPRSRARRALERAVEMDPSFPEAARLLSSLAAQTRDRDASVLARNTLAAIAEDDTASAASKLALARAAEAVGELETAAAAALAATRDSNADSAAVAHHTAARILLRLPGREKEGASEYFLGLNDLTRDRAKLYYSELRGIATTGELQELELLPAARAADWIRTFWDMHAALSAVTVPMRLSEHFSRLAVAETRFPRRQRHGAPGTNALLYERPESPFDDRGVIYIRHGEPQDIITSSINEGDRRVVTQSWMYPDLDGEPVMYHFVDGRSEKPGTAAAEWYLMYNLPCDFDYMAARAQYDKRLTQLMHRCDAMSVRGVSVLVRRDAYDGLATERANPGFKVSLPATYDTYTFRNPAGTTDIIVAMGIDAAGMIAGTTPDGARAYSANTSFVVVDTAMRSVFRADTVLRAAADVHAGAGSVLRGEVYLNVKPGPGMVHRASIIDANAPDRGQIYGGPVVVPDYRGQRLMMSDVVLAVPDTAGSFRRGDVSLTTVPWQAFERGAFRIFYELYNMPAGASYTTEVKVEGIGGGITGAVRDLFGRRPPVSLRFTDQAPADGGVIQQVRDAQADLGPGEYKLTVTITDPAGNRVTRERVLTVMKPGS